MSHVWGDKFVEYMNLPEGSLEFRPISQMLEHRSRERVLEWVDHYLYNNLDPEKFPAQITYWTEHNGTEISCHAQIGPFGGEPDYATTMVLTEDKYDEFCKHYEARYDCKEGPDDESGRETAGREE